jgi:hypothetical protein
MAALQKEPAVRQDMLAEVKIRGKAPPVPGAGIGVTVTVPPIFRHTPDQFSLLTPD